MEKALAELELSDDQKENMITFLKEKRIIIRFGDLKEQDFERITELGSGNGGVVLKVKHIPSKITMARKVSLHAVTHCISQLVVHNMTLAHCRCIPNYQFFWRSVFGV